MTMGCAVTTLLPVTRLQVLVRYPPGAHVRFSRRRLVARLQGLTSPRIATWDSTTGDKNGPSRSKNGAAPRRHVACAGAGADLRVELRFEGWGLQKKEQNQGRDVPFCSGSYTRLQTSEL